MITTEQKQVLRFMARLSVFAFCIGACLILISYLGADDDAYAKSHGRKIDLLKNTPAPRVIIIGGSGSAVGFDSPLFLEKTGLKPVNMGVFAGFGLRFMFKTIEPHLKQGDIVIVLPEYELLQQPPWGDGHILLETLQSNPTSIVKALNYHTAATLSRAFPQWFANKMSYVFRKTTRSLPPSSVYSLKNLNGFGDLVDQRLSETIVSEQDLKDVSPGFVRPSANPMSLSTLASFIDRSKNRGITVFVSWAPLPDVTFGANKDAVSSRETELIRSIGDHIIGTPETFVYPASKFFDAPTHLNLSGKKARTLELIRLISHRV